MPVVVIVIIFVVVILVLIKNEAGWRRDEPGKERALF